jgi:hypothetical protein
MYIVCDVKKTQKRMKNKNHFFLIIDKNLNNRFPQ